MSKGIILFVEGETDEEIYNKFKQIIRSMCKDSRFIVDKFIVRNLKGIGNYKTRINRVYKNDIMVKNPEIDFDIFLSYDTDIFDYEQKPKIDWEEVERILKKDGAKNVYHIKVKKSIEDWILRDVKGVLDYLKMSSSTNITGRNGLEKIQLLFKKAKKVYVKGYRVQGLVDNIDIKSVMCQSCVQLKPLCKKLGVSCSK